MSDPKTPITESSKRKEKAQIEYVPEDPESESSLSDLSLREYNSSNDNKYKSKRRNKNKNQQDSSGSFSSNSDLLDESNYKSKICHKKKKYWKKKQDPIKLCAKLTEKLLTPAYILTVLKFKLVEDMLQSRIYFSFLYGITGNVFSQYKITYYVLLYYPTVGGVGIKDYVKKAIRNIPHENIYVHTRILNAEFPVDGVNCTSKLQAHCVNMTFSDKSRYANIFQ